MSAWQERRLGELLRLLPSAPVAWLERARAIGAPPPPAPAAGAEPRSNIRPHDLVDRDTTRSPR
jgi:hypothetical protein